MKKHSLVLVLVILCCYVVEGQSKYYKRSEPKQTYGIKAGITIASQLSPDNDGVFEVKSLLLFHAGGYYSYRFNRNFIVQPELMISGKGSHWTDPYDDIKDIITYLDLPVLIKYQLERNFNIHLGPQVGYVIKALQKDLKTGMSSDISYIYNKFDFSLVGGLEVSLHPRIKLMLRYVQGLSSATNDFVYEYKCFNSYFQFSLSYRLSG
jgi:hypothetical protein